MLFNHYVDEMIINFFMYRRDAPGSGGSLSCVKTDQLAQLDDHQSQVRTHVDVRWQGVVNNGLL